MNKLTIRDNVTNLLESYPNTRNSDKALLAYYWKEVDGIEFPMSGNDFVKYATSPASIIRARALIQEDGMYLPNKETIIRRRCKEATMRNAVIKYREVLE